MRSAALRKPHPDHRPMSWREPVKVQAHRLSCAGNVVPFSRPNAVKKAKKPADAEGYAKAINRQRVEYIRTTYPFLWGIWVDLEFIERTIRDGNLDSALKLADTAKGCVKRHAEQLLGIEDN